MHPNRRHVLIAGCGYVGQRLALRVRGQYQITGGGGRAEGAATERARVGIRAAAFDLDRVRAGVAIPERLDEEAIVYLTPPPLFGESGLLLGRVPETGAGLAPPF